MTPSKIIIVDDNEASRYVKSHVLKRAGYTTYHATTGEQALELVRLEQPDLVLLDVKLPDMTGFEVCATVKHTDPSILVLQTSAAFVDRRDRVLGLSGGADSYLVEPVEAGELLATVASLLRLRKAEQALRRANEELEEHIKERTKDLTEALERLKQENEQRLRAERELQHALKLDALGQLTGGVAHDFNNLLTVVLASFSLVRRNLQQRGAAETHTDDLITHGERAANDCAGLIRQLLAFSRKQPVSTEIVSVNNHLMDFEGVLRRAVGESIELQLIPSADIWTTEIDTSQFEAAVLNLITNARDAMQGAGTIRVLTSNVAAQELGSEIHGAIVPRSLPQRDYVAVAVIDTGPGIGREIAERVFEPFFTTKEIGKGTGLGLSQVHGFATGAGGTVLLKSAIGEGTTIVILLPRSSRAAEDVHVGQPDTAPALSGKSVLLVEDNELVRETTAAALRALGCTIVAAGDGVQALESLGKAKSIDILVSDVVLPNQLNGLDLARKALSMRPHLCVLLTSGYASEALADEAQREFRFLPKPYTPDDLAHAVVELSVSAHAHTGTSAQSSTARF